jgi:hypothetical protein
MTADEMTFVQRDVDGSTRCQVEFDNLRPSIGVCFSNDGSSCHFDIDDLEWLQACLARIAEERKRFLSPTCPQCKLPNADNHFDAKHDLCSISERAWAEAA